MSAFQLAAAGATGFLGLCAVTGRLTFLQTEFATTWRRLLAAALLVAILAAVVFYPVTGGYVVSTFEIDDPWFPALFFGHGLLLLFLVMWWTLRSSASRSTFTGSLAERLWSDVRLGVIVGLGGWVVTLTVTFTIAVIGTRFGVTPTAPEDIPPLMVWLAALLTAHKLVVIAAAMSVEEAFFRGFLQTRFGLLLSSLLFTAAHASYGLPFMLISVLTISLLIGSAYRRRGRLLPCIVAHGVFDSIQLLVILPWAVRLLHAAS